MGVANTTEQTPESQGPARLPAKRKTGAGKRARKFPLTLHCTGQYCKKIRGRIHYFGRDKQEALRKYYEQASALHSGTSETAALLPSKLTLENLCNLYLDHQLGRAKARRVHFPRPKTGVDRNFVLWPQTVEALKAVPVRGEFVFYTRCGNTWGWRVGGRFNDKPLTKAFKTLMKKAGVPAEKGTGFYTLRRTAATIAAGTGDVFAVQGILGHADLAMASTYVQKNKLTPQPTGQ